MLKIVEWLLGLFRRPPPVPVESSPAPAPTMGWIGLEQFRKATGLPAVRAQDWYAAIQPSCIEFHITTPERIAAFIAQTGHESMGFSRLREIWGPTPAQLRYEGRADLGNTRPGDGSKYRGRALIHITGRDNYAAVSRALGIDAVNNPAILEQPLLAARASAWWWAVHGCNELADSGDFRALTRRINGGLNGLDDRMARWERAKGALA